MTPIKYIQFAVELKTITPIHIGSGRQLQKGLDFFVEKNKLGKIDLKKIYKYIPDASYLTHLISDEKNIFEDLKRRGVNLETLAGELLNVNDLSGQKLHEFIRNGLTREPVIPGSSIKGAIRTTLITKPLIEEYKSKINILLKIFNKYKKNDTYVLHSILKIKDAKKPDPKNNIFKYIQITDAIGTIDNLSVDTYRTLNMDRDEKWYIKIPLTQSKEVFKGTVRFKIKIDNRFFEENKLGIERKKDFFDRINHHTRYLLNEEILNFEKDLSEGFFNDDNLGARLIKNLKEISKNNDILLRMSAGSGWDFMTGAWLKEISDKKQWHEIKKKLVKRRGYEEFPFPKTRRITSQFEFPGFVSLKIIDG